MIVKRALRLLPQRGVRLARELARRFRRAGFKSGMVCLRVHWANHRMLARTRRGIRNVACPCCGWEGAGFLALDCHYFVVPGVFCPACGCQERHRLLQKVLDEHTPEFLAGTGRVLLFAADDQVRRAIADRPALRAYCTDYGDYDMHYLRNFTEPAVQADMHTLPFPDNSFLGAFCLHVLEHVRDDGVCLAELHRVLAPGGQAVLMVPFMMDQDHTIEYGRPDPNLFDHVRGYAIQDFKDRLKDFDVQEILPLSILTREEQITIGTPDHQAVYVCTKPASAAVA